MSARGSSVKMKRTALLCLLICFSVLAGASIRPAKIFSDNMVLQRDVAIPVWGTALPGEQIILQLGTLKAVTTATPNGYWMAKLPRLTAGGPYQLEIKGNTEKIVFENVLIGDVWFASGQSNMEHPVVGWEYIPHSAVNRSEKEIVDSDYPEIRLFSVPKFPSPVKQNDLQEGSWKVAGPQSVAGFSSVAWFFSKELQKKLKVPIGIIDSSWGGTPIQTWMSRESLEPFKASVKGTDAPEKFEQNVWCEKVSASIEMNRIRRNRISYPLVGLPEKINSPDFDDSSWKLVDLLDENCHFGPIVWFRKRVLIPESFTRNLPELSLGFLNRQSQVFFNGAELGYFLYPQPVKVQIPRQLVRKGENILSIRLAQPWSGTHALGKREQFYVVDPSGGSSQNLAEGWRANDRLELVMPAAESFQNNPAFLYNGMVAPLIPYAIKGFIWYQGESNAGEAGLYGQMFEQLIVNWRTLWKNENLPFLFVQTSNIELSHEFEKKSDTWCLLREAQQKALSLPLTGMVVSLDIGDPYDVHPKNKQDFGHRLALQAFKIAYHQHVIADGPVYESVAIKGDTLVVRLKKSSCRLFGGDQKNLSGFEIAGNDGMFKEAKALLKNNLIFVFSEDVKQPLAVRYAWTNNPKCSLFNAEGLPMGPFRSMLK